VRSIFSFIEVVKKAILFGETAVTGKGGIDADDFFEAYAKRSAQCREPMKGRGVDVAGFSATSIL